jgi:DNA polymerase I-like protein with 3'-5' exonuclease and polymerase domains
LYFIFIYLSNNNNILKIIFILFSFDFKHKFLSINFNQHEIKTIANLSKDPNLIEIFNNKNDNDIIKFVASKLLNKSQDNISNE